MSIKQERYDHLFMHFAIEMGRMSTCVSKYKVGCVLTSKDNRIISAGFSGSLPGCTHCENIFKRDDYDHEAHHKWSVIHEVHAETNAIIDAGKRGVLEDVHCCYVTLFPCLDCAKNLARSGIKRLVYKDPYLKDPQFAARELLEEAGIKVCQY